MGFFPPFFSQCNLNFHGWNTYQSKSQLGEKRILSTSCLLSLLFLFKNLPKSSEIYTLSPEPLKRKDLKPVLSLLLAKQNCNQLIPLDGSKNPIPYDPFGQIIATSHDLGPQMVV